MRFLTKENRNEASGGWIRTMGLGALETMLENRNCQVDSCGDAAVASLAEQNLCLDHFVQKCYAQLDRVDPRTRRLLPEVSDLVSMRVFVEECSRQTLDVCLRSSHLTNLERGRLLDILLWAGELFLLLRAPRKGFADSIGSTADFSLSHVASHH